MNYASVKKGSDWHIPQDEQIELLTDLRDGDDDKSGEAFDVLVGHYRPAMIRESAKLLGEMGMGNSDVEDTVHDVLAEIWAGRARVSTEGKFWMLLLTSLQRRVSNVRRNVARRATDSLDAFVGFDDDGGLRSIDDVHPEAVMDETTPETLLGDEEDATRIRACMAMLKPRHREILRLKYLEERTDAEIAELMGLSGVPRAKSLAYEARRKMRDIVLEHAPDLAEHFG